MRNEEASKIFGPFFRPRLTPLIKLLIVVSEVNHLVEFFCILEPEKIGRVEVLCIFFELRIFDFGWKVVDVFGAFL
jgi:hypothetical protein